MTNIESFERDLAERAAAREGGVRCLFFFPHENNVLTSYDSPETTRVCGCVADEMQIYIYPYDLGCLHNLKEVFGRSYLTWCVSTPAETNGLWFKTVPVSRSEQFVV